MPRADKDKYTDKQKRQAQHIEEGYRERGLSEEEAERRAWATVNAVIVFTSTHLSRTMSSRPNTNNR